MKKLLTALALSCFVLSTGLSVAAQEPRDLRRIPKAEKSPVKYSNIQAFSDNRGVWLEWETSLESNNLGFTVYKIGAENSKAIGGRFIAGAYLETGEIVSTGKKYSFFDAEGDSSSVYYIESLNASGKLNYSGVISPKYVDDLSAAAGISSTALKSSAKTAGLTYIKDENILPSDLQSEFRLSNASPDAAQQSWIAAQPGVKIGVKKEGIYRVSRAQLQANGLDVSASPEFWQLYANGSELPIFVGGSGDYIEFYGRGIDTREADAQTYFLVVGATPGRRIAAAPRRAVGGRIIAGSYSQSVTKKERFIYLSNILNGDTENFFGTVISTAERTFDVDLTGIDFSAPNTTLDIGVQGSTLVRHQSLFAVNDHEIGVVNGNLRDLAKGTFTIPTSFLVEGANTVKVKTLNSGDVSLVESVKFSYRRKYQARQNSLSFYTSNYRASYLENFTAPNIRVFDVTNSENPVLITNLQIEAANGGFRVFLPSNRGRVMFAVEDSAILAPDFISANQPSGWTSANHDADLIIITHKNWSAQADDWANYRRSQNLSVEVVNIEDIYDEFNYGILSSSAISDFLKYACENWNTKPKYVLLIGDATYDPKNNEGREDNNFIPTRLVDTVYTETGSDDALADFNGDGLAELAIGRLPVRDAAMVNRLLNKIKAFEQTAGDGLSRGVIFASDLPNGYDFEGLSRRVRGQLPQTVNAVMINRGETDARAKLLSEINSGRFFVNYSGHGTASAWANDGFLGKSDFAGNQTSAPPKPPTITNTNLSIFTMLTCLNGYFISTDTTSASDGLAEAMLKEPNGAVAAWASSGLTTPDVQEIMATRFYGQLGAKTFSRLGDLIRDAKTSIDGGRDVRLSWVLLGDPTLKIR